MIGALVDGARAGLEQRRAEVPEPELRARARARGPARSLHAALAVPGVRVIAEVKRRSPSRGAIAGDDLDPVAQARRYAGGGAAAISVLTDETHFGGSLDDLAAVAGADLGVPLLRKDFIVDPYQVVEARAAGADAVLLIAGVLGVDELRGLLAVSRELGMDALVEAHSAADLEVALATDARVVGINNRDLDTFHVSLDTTVSLVPRIHASPLADGSERIVVSESGISCRADVDRVAGAGVRGLLVGEALMRADDPALLLAELAR